MEHELYSCIFHLSGIFISIDELIFERVRYTTNQYKIEDLLKMVDPQVTMNFNIENTIWIARDEPQNPPQFTTISQVAE